MPAGEWVSASDRDLMKRLTIVIAFIFVFTAAFAHLTGVYTQKFYDRTAPAKLLWARHPMSANEPVAFFAAREVDLPANRVYVRLKVLGDPEYTLYVNGREIAGRLVGEDRALDYYDLSEVMKTGRNRIVVAVRAPKGVGAFLAALDLAPETENWMVSDGKWKIYRRWDPLILQYDVADNWETPLIIGAPPAGRWNFLDVVKRDAEEARPNAIAAKESFEFIGLLPTVRTQAGISVAGSERARAKAFAFGPTLGRIRVSYDRPRGFSRLVQVRFANDRSELGLLELNPRAIVFAPGETEVTTPEEHVFHFAVAFAPDVKIEVLPSPSK
ncbi:MAG TPA: hypothetical protein VM733_22690 [Thermoanaerobaculia bacterium]|nr:hypothetical protein [Thermoanaerobaculia bacterium]